MLHRLLLGCLFLLASISLTGGVFAQIGKMSPDLCRKMTVDADQTIRIAVLGRSDVEVRGLREAAEALIRDGMPRVEARAMAREWLATINAATIARLEATIMALGRPVLYADHYAPIVFTTADAATVAVLATNPDIVFLDLGRTAEAESHDHEHVTHRMSRVFDFGVRGVGVKAAVIEEHAISGTHPALNVTEWFDPTNLMVGGHPTAVAGVLGASGEVHPGAARGVELLSGNANSFVDMDLMAATSWAITQGADVINMSFGFDSNSQLTVLDVYVDFQVRFAMVSITKSSGNRGLSDGDVSSPGLAWNVLTVGNFYDAMDGDWDNDIVNPLSSFNNPISPAGDRVKPDLMACGTFITTTTTNGGYGDVGMGSSFSAPVVAGVIATLIQVRDELRTSPEGCRAVLMAAADHNLEGASRLSDRDGAGGLNALTAYRIAEGVQFSTGSLTMSDFVATGTVDHAVDLVGGERTRIVLAWSSDATTGSAPSDSLAANLDLSVIDSSGNVVATSNSVDNSFEIVEFIPSNGGTHVVRIDDTRFDGASEPYALAWTQERDGRHVQLLESRPVVTSGLPGGPVVGNLDYRLAPYDPAHPGGFVVTFASLADNIGFDLGDGRVVEANVDSLTSMSLDPMSPFFSGVVATYDVNGLHEGYSVLIPDLPPLVGFPVYFSCATVDPMASANVASVGRPRRVRFEDHPTTITLTDDGSHFVANMGGAFPFFGGLQSQCWVNANGSITFGSAENAATQNESEFLNGPMVIAPLWTDLDPSLGGSVRITAGTGSFIVEWVGVPDAVGGGSNSVVCIWRVDGRIDFLYGPCSASTAIVGVHRGNGLSATAVDLSAGWQEGAPDDGLYENLTDFDLADGASQYRKRVTFTPITEAGVTRYRVTVGR